MAVDSRDSRDSRVALRSVMDPVPSPSGPVTSIITDLAARIESHNDKLLMSRMPFTSLGFGAGWEDWNGTQPAFHEAQS
ncbi:hypothetical protein N7540_010611 [Penicillium herquei]|nr:hypothetical protein N7540_010611 [Penicillium herquei]